MLPNWKLKVGSVLGKNHKRGANNGFIRMPYDIKLFFPMVKNMFTSNQNQRDKFHGLLSYWGSCVIGFYGSHTFNFLDSRRLTWNLLPPQTLKLTL